MCGTPTCTCTYMSGMSVWNNRFLKACGCVFVRPFGWYAWHLQMWLAASQYETIVIQTYMIVGMCMHM